MVSNYRLLTTVSSFKSVPTNKIFIPARLVLNSCFITSLFSFYFFILYTTKVLFVIGKLPRLATLTKLIVFLGETTFSYNLRTCWDDNPKLYLKGTYVLDVSYITPLFTTIFEVFHYELVLKFVTHIIN